MYQVLFITTLKDEFYYFSYFTDEKTEAEKLNSFPQVVELGPKCRQNWQSLAILVCVHSFLHLHEVLISEPEGELIFLSLILKPCSGLCLYGTKRNQVACEVQEQGSPVGGAASPAQRAGLSMADLSSLT